jgi:replicative DNA helicase
MLHDAFALLDDADEDADSYDLDGVLAELLPVVRRNAQRKLLEDALNKFGKHKDLTSVAEELEKASRIGAVDKSVGDLVSSDSIDRIKRLRSSQKLPTGIDELDAALAGGMRQGSLGIYVGPSASGKSMALVHAAAHVCAEGGSVAYATMELASETVEARIISNLTGASAISDDPRELEEALLRMEALEADGLVGHCSVQYFSAHATTVADLEEWLKSEEERHGSKIDLVCVDYLSLLSSHRKKTKHEEITDIVENLRALAVKGDRWVWTASQVKASAHDSKNKQITMDQAAGSMGVSRTADIVVTLNPRDEGATIMYRVDKNRHGPGGENVGPLPHHFEMGRMCPVNRAGWPFK